MRSSQDCKANIAKKGDSIPQPGLASLLAFTYLHLASFSARFLAVLFPIVYGVSVSSSEHPTAFKVPNLFGLPRHNGEHMV